MPDPPCCGGGNSRDTVGVATLASPAWGHLWGRAAVPFPSFIPEERVHKIKTLASPVASQRERISEDVGRLADLFSDVASC